MAAVRRTFVWITLLLMIALGLVLGRNYQLDSAAAAIKTGNGAVAVSKLEPLAVLGDRNAQTLLGYLYAYGWGGTARNEGEAMSWFSRPAVIGEHQPQNEGNPGASEAFSIAKAYANGSEGVQPDLQESRKWLELAARAGNREAAAELSKSP
jgi:TPR repeat protein